jgi:hypothetical protein
MGGTMMNAARGEQIFGLVLAAFGAQLDVMHIDIPAVSAAGHAATPLIAQQHGAA